MESFKEVEKGFNLKKKNSENDIRLIENRSNLDRNSMSIDDG